RRTSRADAAAAPACRRMPMGLAVRLAAPAPDRGPPPTGEQGVPAAAAGSATSSLPDGGARRCRVRPGAADDVPRAGGVGAKGGHRLGAGIDADGDGEPR